jgi:hypothetical protein
MGRRPFLRKLRAVFGVGLLALSAATISAIVVSKYDLFSPKDYEDCAERAARGAKSKDALSVLLSICGSEFKGRRKAGGGYTFFDICQNREFDIKGPNLNEEEQKYLKEQCLAHIVAQAELAAKEEEAEHKARQATEEARAKAQRAAAEERARAQQAAQEAEAKLQARKLAALSAIHVISSGFELCDFGTCFMKVEVTNESKEALSGILIGLSTIPTTKAACPLTYAKRQKVNIQISPGERRGEKIYGIDIEFSKHPVCIKVLDVAFVDDGLPKSSRSFWPW